MQFRRQTLFVSVVFIPMFFVVMPLEAQQTPYLGVPVSLPGTVQAENYDLGGEGIAWHDTTAGNVFGVYRNHDMDVGAISVGGYHIGALAAGEWAEYLVNVTTTGSYNLVVRYASAYPYTTRFRVLLDGVDLTGAQSIGSTGGWQSYTTRTVAVSLTAGSNRVLRVNFEAGEFNLDSLQFLAASCTPPAITTHPLSHTLSVGETKTLTAAASGSAPLSYQWFRNGVAIAGATSASYTIVGAEQGKDGGDYTLRATNSCGSATSQASKISVACGPDGLRANINRALRGGLDICDWSADVSPSFPYNYGNGVSYNIPVLAAANALIKEPVRSTGTKTWNMYTWWSDYLQRELGDLGSVWYYGGQELGSGVYQHFNISAIAAVHFHANAIGRTAVRDLARRWLRATFALHALAASPGPVRSFHAKGQQAAPRNSYNGPYVGMAGMRTSWESWFSTDRNIVFSQAVGIVTNGAGEDPTQRDLRAWIESRWNGPNGNVYGLNTTEQGQLRATVQNSTLPPNLVSSFLGVNLRTHVRYHFVGWPGVKVTLMTTNRNGNTTPTYGVAFFAAPKMANGQEAHFLYPWQGLFIDGNRWHRKGITEGSATLDVTHPTNRYIEATNSPGSATHPIETVRIDGLPLTTRSYWVILDPAAPPSVQ